MSEKPAPRNRGRYFLVGCCREMEIDALVPAARELYSVRFNSISN